MNAPVPRTHLHTRTRFLRNITARAQEVRISEGCYVYKIEVTLALDYVVNGARKVRRETFESPAFAYSHNDEMCFFGVELGNTEKRAREELLESIRVYLEELGFSGSDVAKVTNAVVEAIQHREFLDLN